ncbi:hypothetical protein GCM10010532_034800 [Dactylosporangium siamense]|uniref:Septum formation-related domain-containing protein n=1 Tax=Dactylosporangium siamense TaxID=685454 RepID=A0A919UBJ0_9ACTN|nr:hypothetical protein Dsi01nite_027240 [Dactylosporangium siamense]
MYIAVLLCIGGALLWHSVSSGADGSGLGCYATPPAMFPGLPDSGQLRRSDCGGPHDWEVISLLRSDDAEERCQRQADAFLGGPWQQSRVVYGLLEVTDQVRGGLFCALAETSGTDAAPIGGTGSLKDGLRGDRRLAITCLVKDDENFRYGDCGEQHAAEVVGALADGADVEAGCPAVAAGYLSLTEAELRDRGDLEVRWFEDGSQLCLVSEPDDPAGRHDTLRGTVKGLGRAPLPR